MRRAAKIVVLALAALVLAACGGDGHSGYAKEAGEHCQAARKQIEKINAQEKNPAKRVELIAQPMANLNRELGRLDPPPAQKKAYEEFREQLTQIVNTLNELAPAIAKQDQAAAVDLQDKLTAIQREANVTAPKAGIIGCA